MKRRTLPPQWRYSRAPQKTNPRLLQPRLIDVIGAGGSGADELNGLAGEQCFIDPGDRAHH